ncbi:MAG: tetratricopeptide repeat protein [Chitinophagales bacterium]|nr:tetratricopeptide repeat protein [Chitinophagales bacterium]
MKKLLTTLLMISAGIMLSQAQSSKVMSAMNYYDYWINEGRIINLDKSKKNINAASKNEKTALLGKTWFWKGIIYQEIAGTPEMADTMKKDPLGVALASYKKAATMEDKKFKAPDRDKSFLQVDNIGMMIFDKGFQNYENGNFQEAYKGFMDSREIILFLESNGRTSLNPNKDNALKNASLAAANGKMVEKELETYQIRLDEGEDNPLLYKAIADKYIEQGKTDMAKEFIAKGLEKYPSDIDLMIEDLNFYLQEDKLEEAIEKLEKAAELDSDNEELLFVLGTAYDKTDDRASAEEAYERALEANPEHFKSLFNLGALYFNKAVKLNEEMNNLSYKQQEKYDELLEERNMLFRKAKPFFEKALEINPEEVALERELKRIKSALGAE